MFEDLIAGGRSGVSRFYVDNFSSTSNIRKNRRVIDQSAVAQILVVADSLRASDSKYSDTVTELDDMTLPYFDDCAQSTIYEAGSKIRVDSMVTRRMYLRGEALREAMFRTGESSDTARFYLQVLLCESIAPLIGAQTLLRVGQTAVYNRFWFTLAPLLISTGQSNYQKLVAMHMFVLAVLPDAVVSDLLLGEPGCLVVCRDGNNRIAHLPMDERLECNVKTVKQFLGKEPGDPLNCISWVSELTTIRDALSRELNFHGRKNENEHERDEHGILLGYDREARTAANVAAFIEFMREKRFLSSEHFNCEGLQNWLSEVRLCVPRGEGTRKLLNLYEDGKVKLEILVSCLLPPYFESEMSSADILAHGMKKALRRGHWTRAIAVKSMKQMANVLCSPVGAAGDNARNGVSRSGCDPKQVLLTHTKRVSKILRILQEFILSRSLPAAIVSEAERAAARVQKISPLVSSQSTAYGF